MLFNSKFRNMCTLKSKFLFKTCIGDLRVSVRWQYSCNLLWRNLHSWVDIVHSFECFCIDIFVGCILSKAFLSLHDAVHWSVIDKKTCDTMHSIVEKTEQFNAFSSSCSLPINIKARPSQISVSLNSHNEEFPRTFDISPFRSWIILREVLVEVFCL